MWINCATSMGTSSRTLICCRGHDLTLAHRYKGAAREIPYRCKNIERCKFIYLYIYISIYIKRTHVYIPNSILIFVSSKDVHTLWCAHTSNYQINLSRNVSGWFVQNRQKNKTIGISLSSGRAPLDFSHQCGFS